MKTYKNVQSEQYGQHACLERDIEVNGFKIHIKSIFTEQTKLEDALKKIVLRKLSETTK